MSAAVGSAPVVAVSPPRAPRSPSPGPACGATATGTAHGVGLTPRLYEALVGTKDATIKALPADYVPTIRKHVESVAPSKNVMAQYWCPVVVEGGDGAQHVLHVDPIAVRKFRRAVAEELKGVQEKRRRMLRRIKDIRHNLPEACARDVAARLRHEVADAESRISEPLLHPLPPETHVVYVFLEVTPFMMQLGLVCDCLKRELPKALEAAGAKRISLTALRGSASGDRGGHEKAIVPALEPLDCADPRTPDLLARWLDDVRAAHDFEDTAGKAARGGGGIRLAKALQRASIANAIGEGRGAVLLVSCSPPADLQASMAHAKRSELVLQIAGVFGASPEDAEPVLQQLADVAGQGSSLHLFFGADYWTRFAAVRQRQLERLEKQIESDSRGSVDDTDDGNVVDPKVFEMRLIERVMRECYVEEQLCEQEIRCASHVLERTAVDRNNVLGAIRQDALPRPPGASP